MIINLWDLMMRMLNKSLFSLMLCAGLSLPAYAEFKQAPLPYKSDALEPAIDQKRWKYITQSTTKPMLII